MVNIIGDKRPRVELRRTNMGNGVAVSLRGNVSSIAELLYDAIRADSKFKEAFLEIVMYYIDAIQKDKPKLNKLPKQNKGEVLGGGVS